VIAAVASLIVGVQSQNRANVAGTAVVAAQATLTSVTEEVVIQHAHAEALRLSIAAEGAVSDQNEVTALLRSHIRVMFCTFPIYYPNCLVSHLKWGNQNSCKGIVRFFST